MAERSDEIPWASLFRLSAPCGRPLQVQIRQALVAAVQQGRLSSGARVPGSRELAECLSVARNTVVLAYQQLIDEGFLVSRERSGCYISESARQLGAPDPAPLRQKRDPDWDRRLAAPRSSVDRNIVKPRDWLSYPYPFLYGQFDPSLFPIQAWRECARMALSVLEIRDWARDFIDGDDPDLIEQLRLHVLPRRGIWAADSEIIVTLGAQQALFLLACLLVQAGRTVVGIEDPGYPDARHIFRRLGAEVAPQPVDEHGLVLDDRLGDCDIVYVTPGSQCPTTVPLSVERRRRLLDLAAERDRLIIEDDYEGELFGRGPQPASLKSLDQDGRVLYMGSFSKALAPGLRLGYLVAPEPVVRELRALRRLMLRHPPANNQRATALFLSLGHYDAHLRRLQDGLSRRAVLVEEGLTRWFPDLRDRRNLGSASVWIEGSPDLDGREFAKRASRRGVLVEPGDVFFATPEPCCGSIRLGFASIASDKVEPGLKLLAEVARDMRPVATA